MALEALYLNVNVTDGSGNPAPNIAFTVKPHGSANLATLYTDRTSGVVGPNPVSTNAFSDLEIFADPGTYDATSSLSGQYGSFSFTIVADPTTYGSTFAPIASVGYSPKNAAGPVPVASRNNNYYSGAIGSSVSQTYRSKHCALADITSLVLVYGNWNGTAAGSSGDGAGNLTVTCSVESLGGTIVRGYFGGQRTGTVGPSGLLYSDPIPVQIPKGTFFYIRSFPTGNYPTGLTGNYARVTGLDTVGDGLADSGEGIANPTGTDVTASGSITLSSVLLYSPCAILGTTRTANVPCLVAVGDSIQEYSNEAPDMGWLVRAVGNNYPYLRLSQAGETAQQWAIDGTAANLVESRLALARFGTHFVFADGRNDLSASRTLAQVQADWITAWSRIMGNGTVSYQTTITPKTTSTDSWITLGNQTTDASDTVRTSANTWLRDGAPMSAGAAVATGTTSASRCPVYSATGSLVTAASGPSGHPLALGGILEVADIIESARNSGKFNVASVRTVTDGAITTGTKAFTSATAAFTAADLGAGIVVAGAGAASAALLTTIAFVTSATAVVVAKTAGTTVSGAATTSIGISTYDGTHPNGDAVSGHRKIAAVQKVVLDAAIAAYRG